MYIHITLQYFTHRTTLFEGEHFSAVVFKPCDSKADRRATEGSAHKVFQFCGYEKLLSTLIRTLKSIKINIYHSVLRKTTRIQYMTYVNHFRKTYIVKTGSWSGGLAIRIEAFC